MLAIKSAAGAMMFGICLALVAGRPAAAQVAGPAAARPAPADAPFEMVDPDVFRVCADPNDLPYSDTKGEGFENKMAEMFAKALGKRISYTWYPNAPGFVRKTLSIYRCDVIMGVPQGDDIVQVTNPYYHSAYTLVYLPGHGLDGVDQLTDPRLKEKRLGGIAGTPPATNMTLDGLIAKAKPYPLVIDTRYDSSAAAMIHDIVSGEIDGGVLWGPLAGYYAANAGVAVNVVPLLKETNGPKLHYRIGLGVRHSDQNWKRELNRLIREEQPKINQLLAQYGIPLLDDRDRPLTPTSAPSK